MPFWICHYPSVRSRINRLHERCGCIGSESFSKYLVDRGALIYFIDALIYLKNMQKLVAEI